jgi:hypothetical protein
MKALILHVNRWASRAESPSERIGDCEPETIPQEVAGYDDTGEGSPHLDQRFVVQETECLVIFFQVEKDDTEKQVRLLCKDIPKIAVKVGTKCLVVECFAHLSHSRPDPIVAKRLVEQVLKICRNFEGYTVKTSPFGWNKGLELDVKGHPDAFKHRSY